MQILHTVILIHVMVLILLLFRAGSVTFRSLNSERHL